MVFFGQIKLLTLMLHLLYFVTVTINLFSARKNWKMCELTNRFHVAMHLFIN